MAVFDPQFQSADVSIIPPKEVSQPQANKGLGIALETAGKAIEGGVKFADTMVKESIDQDLGNKVRDQQSQFLAALDGVAKGQGTTYRNPLDAHAEDTNVLSTPSGPPPDVKSEIDQGVSEVQRLKNANDAQKLTRIGLDQKLYPILQDLRSRHPGYVDYIDQRMSSITGYNVANSLISEKLRAINENASDTRKEREYYEKALVQSGLSGADEALGKFQSGQWSVPRVQQFLTQGNIAQQQVKDKAAAFQLSGASLDYAKSQAESVAYAASSHAATEFYQAKRRLQDPELKSDDDIISEMNDIAEKGTATEKQERVRYLGQVINSHMARNYAETKQLLDGLTVTVGNKNYSASQLLGPKRMKEILDENIGSLYTSQLKMLGDENFGLMFSTRNAVADSKDRTSLKFLNAPDPTGAVVRTATALNSLFPQMSPDLQNQVIASFTSNKGAGGQGFVSELRTLASQQKKQAITQTNGDQADGASGSAYTFTQAQKEQDKAAADPNIRATPQERGEALKDILSMSSALKEKSPQVVDNAIKFFFSPSERQSLNKLVDDYYDPRRSVIISGRTAAFSQLTEPEIAKNIMKRATEGNGLAWDNYKSWVENNAIAGLTTVAKTWNETNSQVNQGNHHFFWNTDTHQIGLIDNHTGKEIDIESMWRQRPDYISVRNANKTFEGMANIARQEKDDPKHIDAFIFRSLVNAGWDANKIELKGANTGPTQKILKAITSAHQPPAPEAPAEGKTQDRRP